MIAISALYRQTGDKMITQSRSDLRGAIVGGATGDAAYTELIKFDEELCSEFDGFKMACTQVGLPVPTLREFERFWKTIEQDDD